MFTTSNNPTVLIIDDEVDICYLLSSLLKKKNFETLTAFDLTQARQVLSNTVPDIVFLDNYLTDGLGMHLIKHIKQLCPGCKIIMITAYDDDQCKTEAFGLGVDDFISKPLRWQTLSKTLEKLLNKSSVPQ